MSFYDWYCDLPPASPQIWGEQTDVPESADWYNSTFIIAWGSNVPQTRTPDAHFFTEVRYKGAKTVAVTPDYSEVAKLADLWLHPKQGTDAALAMAMGHVILKEFYFDSKRSALLRRLRAPLHRPADAGDAEGAHAARRREDRWCPTATCAPRLRRQARPGQQPGVEDRGLRRQRQGGAAQRRHRLPLGPDGRADQGKWNLEAKEARHGSEVKLKLSLLEGERAGARDREGRLPLLRRHRQRRTSPTTRSSGDVLVRTVPVQRMRWARRRRARGAGGHRVRPAGGELRRRARPAASWPPSSLRRRHALHAGLAGTHHRRAARRSSSPWRASSPTTPTRRRASRWSSSARR